jgi:hypothetical protein
LKENEFEFSIDTNALEIAVLRGTSSLRVSEIDSKGWTIYKKSFSNSCFDISLESKHEASVKVKSNNVFYLHSAKKPSKMVCYNNGPVVYVNFIFTMQKLEPSTYGVPDNTFLVCNSKVFLINIPTENKKIPITQAIEVDFDPKSLYFADAALFQR